MFNNASVHFTHWKAYILTPMVISSVTLTVSVWFISIQMEWLSMLMACYGLLCTMDGRWVWGNISNTTHSVSLRFTLYTEKWYIKYQKECFIWYRDTEKKYHLNRLCKKCFIRYLTTERQYCVSNTTRSFLSDIQTSRSLRSVLKTRRKTRLSWCLDIG